MHELLSVKLAVFDCDGTIVDSQFAIHSCMREAFTAVGLAAPDVASVRRVVGLPLVTAIRVLLEPEDGPFEEIASGYSQAWQLLRQQGGLDEPIFCGMSEVIDELREDGWLLGVATGKSSRGLDATLAHHGLSGCFSTLQTADRAKGKPDPEMLERAMMETNAQPQKTVMIGDTTFDVEMAVAASVRSIGVAWGYHREEELRAAGADDIVHDVADLRHAVEKLVGSSGHE